MDWIKNKLRSRLPVWMFLLALLVIVVVVVIVYNLWNYLLLVIAALAYIGYHLRERQAELTANQVHADWVRLEQMQCVVRTLLFEFVRQPRVALSYQVLRLDSLDQVEITPADPRGLCPVLRYSFPRPYGVSELSQEDTSLLGVMLQNEIKEMLSSGYVPPPCALYNTPVICCVAVTGTARRLSFDIAFLYNDRAAADFVSCKDVDMPKEDNYDDPDF